MPRESSVNSDLLPADFSRQRSSSDRHMYGFTLKRKLAAVPLNVRKYVARHDQTCCIYAKRCIETLRVNKRRATVLAGRGFLGWMDNEKMAPVQKPKTAVSASPE